MNTISNIIKISHLGKKRPLFVQIEKIKVFLQSTMCTKTASTQTTVNAKEVENFRNLSNEWWRYNGKFQALKAMNDLRVPMVRNVLSTKKYIKPLEGFKIVDVGCGGGFFSEPLARLGAKVVGIDPVEENINVAIQHASVDPDVYKNVTYICESVDEFAKSGELFDVLVCSEVVEHVDSLPDFLLHCSKLVKVNGSLFFTTVNRTFLSYVTAIFAGEYVLRQIPLGTHQWEKFVKPEELRVCLESLKCHTNLIHGMLFNPITAKWSWSGSTQVSYALHAVKTNNYIGSDDSN